jgi:ComF family protein
MRDRIVFDDAVLVYVPTATARVRQRGFDQAQLIARQLSRMSGLSYRSYLRRMGQARQVGAGKRERAEHLRTAFRAVHESALQGAHIILVDDVLTSGATLEAAARTLKAAGATRIDAVVFAQA